MKTYKRTIEKLTLVAEQTVDPTFKVTDSKEVNEYVRKIWPEDIGIRESMIALYLNRANKIVGHSLISSGGVAGTVADPKIIFSTALLNMASGIILVHNHPSGNLSPSTPDIQLTKKIKEGGKLLEIQLLDHLILSPFEGKYFSFESEGIL